MGYSLKDLKRDAGNAVPYVAVASPTTLLSNGVPLMLGGGDYFDQKLLKPGRDKANKAASAEDNLTALQLQQLQDSIDLQKQLLPLQLQQMGLVSDGKGGYRRLTDTEKFNLMSPLEQSQYNLAKTQLDRESKAAAGTLELPSWLQSDIDKQNTVSNEAITRAYGPNASASTGGIQARAAQATEGARVKDAYAHGQETLGANLFQQNYGNLNSVNQQTLGNYMNAGAPGYGLLSSINAVKAPFSQENMLQQQLQAQQQAALFGGIGNLAGTLGAAALLA